MPTIIQEDSDVNDWKEIQRETIREALTEIVQEVGNRMREAGLTYPVFMTVPGSGKAIVTFATPVDSTNDDLDEWPKITAIIREVVSDHLDGIGLWSHELPCAMMNTPMSAADLTSD